MQREKIDSEAFFVKVEKRVAHYRAILPKPPVTGEEQVVELVASVIHFGNVADTLYGTIVQNEAAEKYVEKYEAVDAALADFLSHIAEPVEE